MSPLASVRAGRVVGLALLTVLGSCRDLPTHPGSQFPGMEPGRPRHTFIADTSYGARNSTSNGTYNGIIDTWDGGAPPAEVPTGVYHYATIVVMTVAGGIYTTPSPLTPNPPINDGPLGRAGYQGAIGAYIVTGNGSAVYWPTTVSDTAKLTGTVYGLRGAYSDPQPEGEWWWTCGKFVSARDGGDRKPCWRFEGSTSMTLTRVPVDLALIVSTPDSVDSGTEVTFTAGMSQTTIAGQAVDMSALRWRWEPDMKGTADTVTCTQTSGASCTRTVAGAGTMFVTAYVNGQQQQKSQRVGVIGKKPGPVPCPTGFSQLDNTVMDSIMKQLWKDSNYSPDTKQEDRREQGGYITLNNGQYGFTRFGGISTPCGMDVEFVPPARTIGMIHTHPFTTGEYMKACGPAILLPNGQPYRISGQILYHPYKNKPSQPDLSMAAQVIHLSAEPWFIMDANKITKYDQNGVVGMPSDRCPN